MGFGAGFIAVACALLELKSLCAVEQHHRVERPPAQRAARRLGPHPGADGLHDALPAEAVVAAGQQLEVGGALHAHDADVFVVFSLL